MDKICALYLKAANAFKLPMIINEDCSYFYLQLGKKKYLFRGGFTPFNDGACDNLSANKSCFNRLLREGGLPVPALVSVSKDDCVNGTWSLPPIKYPVVAKPNVNQNGGGLDVFCNIQDEATLIEYLNDKAYQYNFINIESFERGLKAYRVVVFYNKVIGVLRRDPAAVIGDGIHTIAELIAIENIKRSKITNVTLGNLKIDKEYETKLKEINLTPDSILKLHEKAVLCYVCNAKRGGTMLSLGKAISPKNAALARQAAKILNLNLVGLDILCEDISIPIEESRGFFIEANTNPDISINSAPLAGTPVDIAKILIRHIILKHPFAYAHLYIRQLAHTYAAMWRGVFVLTVMAILFRLIGTLK